jgi:hypothetical protein
MDSPVTPPDEKIGINSGEPRNELQFFILMGAG